MPYIYIKGIVNSKAVRFEIRGYFMKKYVFLFLFTIIWSLVSPFIAIYICLYDYYSTGTIHAELPRNESSIINFIIKNNGKEYKDYSVALPDDDDWIAGGESK